MSALRDALGAERFAKGRFTDAIALFERLSVAETFADFLTAARLRAPHLVAGPPRARRPRRAPEAQPTRTKEPSLMSAGRSPFDPLVRLRPGSPRRRSPAAGTASCARTAREDVRKLRGSYRIEHTLADLGARRLWQLLKTEPYVNALGAITGNQAMQLVRAGLKAIYLSGWQVAADNNEASSMYPDQSLYPANSVPAVVKRINNALLRADQIEHAEGKAHHDWLVPIVADAEAGFGGPLNAFELMKAMIEAGAAGVHFEDQLASEKKCGHMGGKVLVPTSPVPPHPRRRAPRRRRDGRAHAPRRPHRRRRRQAAHHRRRPARPALPHRRAHAARASSRSRAASRPPSPAASPTRPTPT